MAMVMPKATASVRSLMTNHSRTYRDALNPVGTIVKILIFRAGLPQVGFLSQKILTVRTCATVRRNEFSMW